MNEPQNPQVPAESKQRRAARVLLLLVIVGSQLLVWWPREPRQVATDSQGPPLVVRVTSDNRYGEAVVSIDGGSPLNARQAAALIAQEKVDRRSVELHVAGSVRHQQLAVLHRALLDATDTGQVPITFVVGSSSARTVRDDESNETNEPHPTEGEKG